MILWAVIFSVWEIPVTMLLLSRLAQTDESCSMDVCSTVSVQGLYQEIHAVCPILQKG